MILSALFAYCAQLFIAGLWQGLLLVAAVALCLRFAPNIGATARFLIWSLAFALALFAPFLHLGARAQAAGVAAPLRFGIAFEYAIAALWLTLSLARLLQLGAQLYRLRLTRRRATPLAVDFRIAPLLQQDRHTVQLCASTEIDSPSILGFRTHRLLIPDWMLPQLSENDLRQIVLHEMEHLRRGDLWLNLLQRLGLALFPLNPALLWVDRKLAMERELACDAGVVAATAEPLVYARCLTRLAESRLHHRRLVLSLSAWTRQSELGRRVLSLVRPSAAASPRRARIATACVLAGLAIAGVGMSRAPRLVSFSAVAPQAATATNGAPSSAWSPALPAAVPVVYLGSRPAQTAAMDAVSPAVPPRPEPALLKTARRHSFAPHLRTTSSVVRPVAHSWPAQPHLVRSSSSAAAPPSIVPTVYVVPSDRSSYAAFAFGDGWLIVEL